MLYQSWAIYSIYSRHIYEFVLNSFVFFSCVTIFKEKGIMGNKYCPFMKNAYENQSSSQGNTSALLTGHPVVNRSFSYFIK